MRTIILVLAVGMLIFLYSQYVLLIIAIAYILHGLGSRLVGMIWRRGDANEKIVATNTVSRSSSGS